MNNGDYDGKAPEGPLKADRDPLSRPSPTGRVESRVWVKTAPTRHGLWPVLLRYPVGSSPDTLWTIDSSKNRCWSRKYDQGCTRLANIAFEQLESASIPSRRAFKLTDGAKGHDRQPDQHTITILISLTPDLPARHSVSTHLFREKCGLSGEEHDIAAVI